MLNTLSSRLVLLHLTPLTPVSLLEQPLLISSLPLHLFNCQLEEVLSQLLRGNIFILKLKWTPKQLLMKSSNSKTMV